MLALHRARSKAREREGLEDSLTDFTRDAWRYIDPAPHVGGWHIEAICEHLEAVTDGQIRRLLINVPPRTSKSTLCSVVWPAWTWAQPIERHGPTSGPSVQFLTASYAQALSLRDSVKTRRLIDSPWYQERWGNRFYLTGDQNTKVRFDNTAGGYRLATSVGGSLTGEGGAIILVDDPHNAVEMESEIEIANVIDWWDQSMSTRLNDARTGAVVIIMQRLRENDLSGHVLTANIGAWTHLCLPMRYEATRHCATGIGWSDPRKVEGELLCPDRFGDPEVDMLEATLGPFGFAGQMQQRPEPKGGGIIKREYWQAWDTDLAQAYGLVEQSAVAQFGDNALRFPDWSYRVASLDTAYGEKEENDWSALTVWQAWQDHLGNPRVMLVYAWRGRLPLHDPAADHTNQLATSEEQLGGSGLVEKVAFFCKRYKVDRLLIESKANGIDVAREIQRLHLAEGWGVSLIDPKGVDKVARAYSVQALFAGGLVYAPASSDGAFRAWAEMVISECVSFPKGSHDDLVDTVTMALRHMKLTGFAPLPEERAVAAAAAGRRRPGPARPIYPV